MKKFVIKISLAFGIIVVLVLILLVLRSINSDVTAPSYRFLGSRNPTACQDVRTGNMDKCYIYSFEGDFNDVCSSAQAELIGAGFVDRTTPGKESNKRRYWLKGSFPRGPVDVQIFNNHEYIEQPISNKVAMGPKDDWIVVTITYWRNWW